MASLEELKLTHRLFMRGYPFRRYAVHPTPCATLRVPLSQARVALVTSAGFRLARQTPFDRSLKMGDASFREIPSNADVTALIEDHKSDSFDHAGVRADANLALPLDRFRELEQRGDIGVLNHRHFSFMGSIIGPHHLINDTAPQVAQMLADDGVEAVFLTPV